MVPDFSTQLAAMGALKAKIYALPKEIHAAKQRALTAEQQVKALTEDVKEHEMEALLVASYEMTAEGKQKHTNEQSRKAAMTTALKNNPAHRDLVKRLQDAESEALNAKLDVARLEDEQRGFRAVVDITCAEVTLLTSGR